MGGGGGGGEKSRNYAQNSNFKLKGVLAEAKSKPKNRHALDLNKTNVSNNSYFRKTQDSFIMEQEKFSYTTSVNRSIKQKSIVAGVLKGSKHLLDNTAIDSKVVFRQSSKSPEDSRAFDLNNLGVESQHGGKWVGKVSQKKAGSRSRSR